MSKSPARKKLWLSLYLPALALEIFHRPGLSAEAPDHSKAIAVVHQQRIEQLSTTAIETGITPGTMISHAYALCDTLVCIEKDVRKEQQALQQIAQWLYEFTPNIAIHGPQHLILEISGSVKLFSGLETMKLRIKHTITQLGYTPILGLSQTPLAAKVCAERKYPDSHLRLPENTFQSTLLHHLHLPEKNVTQLEKMGVTKLSHLLKLPREGLKKRFGKAFMRELDRLLGHEADPQHFIEPPTAFYSDIFFIDSIDNLQSLIFPIKRLTNAFSAFLTARQLQTQAFEIRLKYRGKIKANLVIKLARADNDVSLFLKLTSLKLDQVQAVKEVDQLIFSASTFQASTSTPPSLFSPSALMLPQGETEQEDLRASTYDPERIKQANDLLSLLQNQLTPENCFGLGLGDDHRPEKSWQKIKPVANHQRQKINPPNLIYPVRPNFILEHPMRLHKDLNPLQHPDFEWLEGPERINAAWWDGDGQNRDYYIYRYAQKTLYWLFYRSLTHRWYWHGVFS
jgi:protein ImuB